MEDQIMNTHRNPDSEHWIPKRNAGDNVVPISVNEDEDLEDEDPEDEDPEDEDHDDEDPEDEDPEDEDPEDEDLEDEDEDP